MTHERTALPRAVATVERVAVAAELMSACPASPARKVISGCQLVAEEAWLIRSDERSTHETLVVTILREPSCCVLKDQGKGDKDQSGAVEAWAHNPQVTGSKPRFALITVITVWRIKCGGVVAQ